MSRRRGRSKRTASLRKAGSVRNRDVGVKCKEIRGWRASHAVRAAINDDDE
jgi:hypothetical protein